jgi:hypothetical protein
VRITKNQTTTSTLADLIRAADHQNAVTITYQGKDGEITIRTVEIHSFRTTNVKVTKTGQITGGDIVFTAMCRLRAFELDAQQAAGEDTTGETAEREFHVSRVIAYTVHRMAYVLTRPEPTTYQRPAPAPTDDAQALFFHELARDKDDVDYQPRLRLAA